MKHKYTKEYYDYCSHAGITPSPKVGSILSKAENNISHLVDMLRRAKCPNDCENGNFEVNSFISLPCEFCLGRAALVVDNLFGKKDKTVAADDDPVEIVNDIAVSGGGGGGIARYIQSGNTWSAGGGGGGPGHVSGINIENEAYACLSIPYEFDGKKIGSISSYCPVGVDMEIKIFPGGKGIGIKTKRENGDSE